MDQLALTTCMPTYNQAGLLPEAVVSVLRQRVPPDRIIILDDASTDGTADYLAGLKREHPQIQVERNPRNLGVVACINRLAGMAESRYIHVLASDDLLFRDFYAVSLEHLARHPQAAFSCMPLTCFPAGAEDRLGEGGPWWSAEARYFPPEELVAMGTHGSIHGNSVVIDREAFLQAGGLVPELEWRSDWFCNWVAAFRQGLVYVPAHLALMRMSCAQYSAGMNDPGRDSQVVAELLRILHGPRFRDVRDAFLASDVLFPLEMPSLYLGLERLGLDPGMREFLKRRAVWELHRNDPVPRPQPDARCNQGYLAPRIARLVEAWKREGHRVVVFGAGEHTGHLFKWTNLAEAELLGIADNNERIHGKRFWGLEVLPPSRLPELAPDVVLVSSAIAQGEISAQLESLLPDRTRVECLYPGERE